jgi:phosphoribosylformimino-5-aminoimidazole carboxamide ribotide isomerase
MLVIPAIDLKGGACVRLRQGRDEETTSYSGDPVAVAEEWKRQGAVLLHVVNLDGAFGRSSSHLKILGEIVARTGLAVEFGGGLRSQEAVDAALEVGAAKVVLGTAAIEDPGLLDYVLGRYGAPRLVVALDALDGFVAVKGWTEVSSRTVRDTARELRGVGVEEVLYTDVRRDGMLTGPDFHGVTELTTAGVKVIASGGVGSLDDLRTLGALGNAAIVGVVVGKALYENRFTLAEAIEAVRV